MAQMSTQRAMQLAVEHHRAGRLDQADAIYRKVIESFPNHSDALDLLGRIEHARGNLKQAESLIRRAIAAAPHVAEYHNHLGVALRDQARPAHAADAYRAALSIRPNY